MHPVGNLREFFRKGDVLLLGLCLLASAAGLLLIYSATRYDADLQGNVTKQALFIAMGVVFVALIALYVFFRLFGYVVVVLSKMTRVRAIRAIHDQASKAAVMAKQGLGYVVSLDKLVDTSEDSPLCFLPLEPPLESGLDVVWKKYQVFSAAAEAFLNRLREQCLK